MNYRVFLMLAGLMMMFAVFSALITVGALVGQSDAWVGNLGLTMVFTLLGTVLVLMGVTKRRKAYTFYEQEIDQQLNEFGYIEAMRFSHRANVSLDEARDLLDRQMKKRRWTRKELAGYNAEYRQLT